MTQVKVPGIYNIRNSGNTAQLEFIGYIGWWQTDSETFRAKMKELKNAGVTDLEVYINTEGGSVFHANEIVNELKQFTGFKKAKLGALCASAGTIIACGFDHVEQADNGQYMIHNPMLDPGSVDERGLESALQLCKSVRESMVKTYSNFTGLPEAEISAMLDATTWMSAQIAKEKGFVHAITSEKDLSNFNAPMLTAHSNNTNNWDWDKYQAQDIKALERLKTENPTQFMNLYNAKYNPDLHALSKQSKQVIPVDRANWSFDDYQEKDPNALQRLQIENNTEFLRLYNAKFGTSYTSRDFDL